VVKILVSGQIRDNNPCAIQVYTVVTYYCLVPASLLLVGGGQLKGDVIGML